MTAKVWSYFRIPYKEFNKSPILLISKVLDDYQLFCFLYSSCGFYIGKCSFFAIDWNYYKAFGTSLEKNYSHNFFLQMKSLYLFKTFELFNYGEMCPSRSIVFLCFILPIIYPWLRYLSNGAEKWSNRVTELQIWVLQYRCFFSDFHEVSTCDEIMGKWSGAEMCHF